MEIKNTTPDALSGANAVASGASDATGAVSSGGAETLTLQEIESILGKSFKTKEAALTSIKDTYSYVGKKIESANTDEAVKPVLNELRALKADLFYTQNPQYAPYKEVISKISENPSDAVGTDVFKKMFESLVAYDKTQNSKSVLDTNSRMGQVSDKMSEAKDLAVKRRTYEQAKAKGMEALFESIPELRGK